MDLGVNLSGFVYSWSTSPDFLATVHAEIDYFSAKGMSVIRVPVSWEQLQPSLNGPLNAAYLASLQDTVAYAAAHGLKVVLDLHNYGDYGGQPIGSAAVPVAAFADLWGRVAGTFATSPNVVFGLMNEPQLATPAWLTAVNAAIGAIRGAGATGQEILVPGTAWDGAATWTTTDNAAVLGAPGAVIDPNHNIAFEVHQYLDDTSGQNAWVVSETIGVERLQAATAWARQNGVKLFLGEFGVADNPTALTALSNMLTYMAANSDVWQGGTYWAAGQGWSNYMFSVEPTLGMLDASQMLVLQRFANAHTVQTALAGGQTRTDTFVGTSATASMSDVTDASGHLVSRQLFDGSGHLERTIAVGSDGTFLLSSYGTPGAAVPSTIELFDANHALLVRTDNLPDGTRTVAFHAGGVADTTRLETYNAHGVLASATDNLADGTHVSSAYTGGVIASATTYDANWTFQSRKTYDAQGHLAQIQSVDAAGENIVAVYDATGTHLVTKTTYSPAWAVLSTASYDATGLLTTIQQNLADGTHTIDHLASTGMVASRAFYDAAWHLLGTDVAPVITSDGGGLTASLVRPENATAVTTVHATDANGAALSFAVVGGADAARFTVDAHTGALAFASAPDFEHPADRNGDNVYQVIVRASDGTLVVDQSLAVAVSNVNDETPVITSNGGGARAAVKVAENTRAVTTVHATDADGTNPGYLIAGGADALKFVIDPVTGALSFVTPPDYEHPTNRAGDNVYQVVVRATDLVHTADQAIAVTVADVAEGAAATAPALAGSDHLNAVYRFYDTSTGHHFYTTSAAEKATLIATMPSFAYEGVKWATPDASAATVDVYRFFDTKTGDHFYTSNPAERDGILKSLPGYQYEGVAFQAYAGDGANGTFALERFFNRETGVHHFSATAGETAGLNAGVAGPAWLDEGPGLVVHAATADMLLL